MKTKTKPITLFVPFTKIERRAEDDALIVEGYCFVNPTVPGDRYSIKRSAMEAATPDYLKFPAVREMHQPIAAGTGLEVIWDERGCLLRSECVDEGTKKKIDKKVLRGYSIGVNPVSVNRADEVESLTWVETSYVDRPKDPDAIFLYRADGFDPEQEVEVEVLEDPSSAPIAAEDAPGLSSGPESVSLLTPTVEPTPSDVGLTAHTAPEGVSSSSPSATTSEETPAAVPAAAGSPSDAERVLAALRAAGIPESMLASVDVVQLDKSLVAERSLGAPVVPIQGPPTEPTADVEDVDEALGGAFPEGYRVEQAPTGMWCAYGGGVKLGEFATAAEARARITEVLALMKQPTTEDAGDARAARAMTSDEVPVRENLGGKKKPYGETVERFVRQKGSQWCVYSESGEELGCHDTHADAVNQLQAIEANKAKERGAKVPPERVEAITREMESLLARATKLGQELAGDASVTEPTAAPTVEAEPPADAPTVSRADVRDDPTEIERLTTANSELLQRLAAHEEVLTRLAATEAEVKRLRNAPLDPEKPPARYCHALSPRYLSNLGSEGDAQIAVWRADYEAAEKEAEELRDGGDRNKLNRATERMILRASQLAERGVLVG